jgi:hypothetical protein
MSFGLTAFSQSSFSALGIITQLAEANLSVEATVTGTAGAVTPASAVVVSSGSVGDSTVDAVTSVVASVTGTATSSSTAIGVANATTSATGEATSTSTARAIANLQATSPAVDSTVVIGGELQEDINSVAISGTSTVGNVDAKGVANQTNLSITNEAIVTGFVRQISVTSAVVSADASVSGFAIRLPFFNPELYSRSRAIYILSEESRVVAVEPETERTISIESDEHRTLKVAA